MRTKYEHQGKVIAIGEIDSLPGSSQVAVFHSAFVLPFYRGKGQGNAAHVNRIAEAQRALFDYALCTVDRNNHVQISILEENGWTRFDTFTSRKTGHDVAIYGRML